MIKYSLYVVFLAFIFSCTSDEDILAEIRSEINTIIGDAECVDDDSCDSIAFGHKPCGGPSTYLIYSKDNIDETLLENKVQEYYELDLKRDIENNYTSTCDIVMPPVVECINSVCVKTGTL